MVSRLKKKISFLSWMRCGFLFVMLFFFIMILVSFLQSRSHLGEWFAKTIFYSALILNVVLVPLSLEMLVESENKRFKLTKRYMWGNQVCFKRMYSDIRSIYWKDATEACDMGVVTDLFLTLPDNRVKQVTTIIDWFVFDLSRSDIIKFRNNVQEEIYARDNETVPGPNGTLVR